MSDVQELQRTNLEIAEAVAPGWARRRAYIEQVAEPLRTWLVGALAPRPGDTVLELAAGAGDTGFEVARRLGADGRLISSDLSPAMLDVARRRGREVGAGNVAYRIIDAERIALDDGAVDGVLCRFGYMLMADPAGALAETRRVLRPGGRLALAVWGAPDRNPYFALAVAALVRAGHLPPPDPSAPGPFSLAGEERITRLLEGAGFADVRVEPVAVRFPFRDVDDYLAMIGDTAGPLALVIAGLDAGRRQALMAELEPALVPFRADGGYTLPGVALCAAAA